MAIEMETWNKLYLESLINNQVEESVELEYKAAASLDNTPLKKKEISKDVSAMANSAGGVLLYGIKEYTEESRKHLPEKIDPVQRKSYSKEWLEQVIQSNIQPKIPNLSIEPISITDDEVVYKILIPQSSLAHQANDKRYYKRYNFESVAMEDYEIKDILNRQKHPNIIMEFEIEEFSYEYKHKRDPLMLTLGYEKKDEKPEIITTTRLIVDFKNVGEIYANYINGYVFIPFNIYKNKDDLEEKRIEYFNEEKYVRCYCDNTVRDLVGYTPSNNPMIGGIPQYGPYRFVALLPSRQLNSRDIELINGSYSYFDKIIYWELNADNAERKKGSVVIEKIERSYKNK